jgi:hypothetical protein
MADLRFAAWAQTRLSRAIATVDSGGPLGAATVKPAVTVAGPARIDIVGPTLTMLGPGAAAGLDLGGGPRTDPPADARDVEDNYLASIELPAPELPWLLTPARAGGEQRLRPWIVLVVVKDADFRDGRLLPVMDVHTDELPDLADSWAWAHVQLPSPDATPPAGLEELVGRTVSRLVCPRRLAPGTGYRACVVPAFAGGVAAGLGGTGPETDSHEPAWRVDQPGRVTLPVFHSWVFTTAAAGGDFESLVRLLQPADLAGVAGFGAKVVDVGRPWPDDRPLLDVVGPQTVAVQGALRPFGPAPEGSASGDALADLAARLTRQLEAPADRLVAGHDPDDTTGAIAPPLYGGRHVNRERVQPDAGDWIAALNLSAPDRIAAGLGTEYVRANQEQLMARAWEQVGAIREANRLRAVAELADDVAHSVHRRHVRTLTTGELVGLTAPAAHRTLMPGDTVLAVEVTVSALPDAAAGTTFARMLRPTGPIARRAGLRVDSVVSAGLRGSVGVPDPRPLLASLSVGDVGAVRGSEMGDATADARAVIDGTAAARQLIALQALAGVAEANGLEDVAAQVADGIAPVTELDLDSVVSGDIAGLRGALAASLTEAASTMNTVVGLVAAAGPAADGRALGRFGVEIDAGELRGRLASALHPFDVVRRRLASRVTVPPALDRPGLDPVMAYPTFPAPMALALLATDKEWFLPGIGAFPGNRVTLLEPNDDFIESYLVGLNHEMMRELRWREYPTDARGTPFSRFWPRPDSGDDVPPVHTWTGPLGDHLTLGKENLSVLLVRGDVLRRFADVVVAAVPAVAGAGGRPSPDLDPTTWLLPLFVVRVDESTSAYAFRVGEAALRARPTPQAPGWFFAFQEHSYRIRFGFDGTPGDAFRTWDDLDWGRIGLVRGFTVAARPVAPPADPKGAFWGTDAADMARIALQKPFRVAIHASALLHGQG